MCSGSTLDGGGDLESGSALAGSVVGCGDASGNTLGGVGLGSGNSLNCCIDALGSGIKLGVNGLSSCGSLVSFKLGRAGWGNGTKLGGVGLGSALASGSTLDNASPLGGGTKLVFDDAAATDPGAGFRIGSALATTASSAGLSFFKGNGLLGVLPRLGAGNSLGSVTIGVT